MHKQWLVYCGEAERACMKALADELSGGSPVIVVDDACALRALIKTMMGQFKTVVLGEGGLVSPLNVAAALRSDGCAAPLLIVVKDAPDALKDRARSLGVERLLSYDEAARAARLQVALTPLGREESAPWKRAAGLEGIADDKPAGGEFAGKEPLVDEPRAEEAAVEAVVTEAPATGLSAEGPAKEPAAEVGAPDATRVNEQSVGAEVASAPAIVLASARGGVGKSTIATTMALAAAAWGMKVALLDLDLGFGNIFGFFGEPRPLDLAPLAEEFSAERVLALGKPVAENVTLFGPCERPEFAEAVAPHAAELMRVLQENYDLVLVDGSTVWGDALAQVAQASDRLALVTDERAGAIGSLGRAATLATRLGVARTRIVRLVNRADPRQRDEAFVVRANAGLDGSRAFRLPDGGFDVGELLNTGHAPELVELNDAFTRSCRSALAQILADVGHLPGVAQKELARGRGKVERFQFFGFGREAV